MYDDNDNDDGSRLTSQPDDNREPKRRVDT
jgi:hypothetical protein